MRRLALVLAATLVTAGCTPAGLDGPSQDALVLAGEVRLGADSLRADLRLTNTSRRPIKVGYGACSAEILAWASPDRSGPPVFTSTVARLAGVYSVGCPMYLALRTLAPSETVTAREASELRVAVALADIVPDSVPDGRYWFTATFDLDEIGGRGGTDLEVDIGMVDVALDRPPLGAEALRLGARFRADSVRVEDGRLRAVLRVAPVPGAGTDVVGWAPCAARILAYSEAKRRDSAPRTGPPDAEADAACGQAPPVPFDGSNADRSGPLFYVGRDASLRAEIDIPLADLLSGQPAGRYALAAAVQTLGPPGYGLDPLAPVYLSLDEVDWRP